MKIRPLNDRILVKRLEGEEKTAGGIIIPDSAKEKPAEGEIKAVGPGKLNDAGQRVAMDVKPGQEKSIRIIKSVQKPGAKMLAAIMRMKSCGSDSQISKTLCKTISVRPPK